MTVIPLGPPLPTGSSRLPADSASSVVVRLFGVAPDGGCRVSPAPEKEATRLCGPVPRLRPDREVGAIAAGRYPASCSVEPGLSSPPESFPGQRRSGRLRSPIIRPRRGTRRSALADWSSSAARGDAVMPDQLVVLSTRQRSSLPAQSGTIVSSPNGSVSGTRQLSRTSVIESAFGGSP
jgi:hypothetical protein